MAVVVITGSSSSGKSSFANVLRLQYQLLAHRLRKHDRDAETETEMDFEDHASKYLDDLHLDIVECRDDQVEAWIGKQDRRRHILCLYLLAPNDFPLLQPPTQSYDTLSRIRALSRPSSSHSSNSHTGQQGQLLILPILSKADTYTIRGLRRTKLECQQLLEGRPSPSSSPSDRPWGIVSPDWNDVDRDAIPLAQSIPGRDKLQSKPRSPRTTTMTAVVASPERVKIEETTLIGQNNGEEDGPLARFATLCASLSPPDTTAPGALSSSPPPQPAEVHREEDPFVRKYPWGDCHPLDPAHSDLGKVISWVLERSQELSQGSKLGLLGSTDEKDSKPEPTPEEVEETHSTCSHSPCLLSNCSGEHHDREQEESPHPYTSTRNTTHHNHHRHSTPPTSVSPSAPTNSRPHAPMALGPDDLPNGPPPPPLLDPSSGRRWPGAPASTTGLPDDGYPNSHPRQSFQAELEMADGEWRRLAKERLAQEQLHLDQQQHLHLHLQLQQHQMHQRSNSHDGPSFHPEGNGSGKGKTTPTPPAEQEQVQLYAISSGPSMSGVGSARSHHHLEDNNNNNSSSSSSSSSSAHSTTVSLDAHESNTIAIPSSTTQSRSSNNTNKPSKPRKPKTQLACTFCRTRKLKCAPSATIPGSQICGECEKRGIACEVAAERENRKERERKREKQRAIREVTGAEMEMEMEEEVYSIHPHPHSDNGKAPEEVDMMIAETLVEVKHHSSVDRPPQPSASSHNYEHHSIQLQPPPQYNAYTAQQPPSQSYHSTREYQAVEMDRERMIERERERELEMREFERRKYIERQRARERESLSLPSPQAFTHKRRPSYSLPSPSQIEEPSFTLPPSHFQPPAVPSQNHNLSRPQHRSHSQSQVRGRTSPLQIVHSRLPTQLPPPPTTFHTGPPGSAPSRQVRLDQSPPQTHMFTTIPHSSGDQPIWNKDKGKKKADQGVVVKSYTKTTSRSGPKVIACNHCRSRKTRCDGSAPCSNCRKRNLECQYQVSAREAARRKRAQAVKNDELARQQPPAPVGPTSLVSSESPVLKSLERSGSHHIPPIANSPHDRLPSLPLSVQSTSFSPRLPSIASLVASAPQHDLGHLPSLKRPMSPYDGSYPRHSMPPDALASDKPQSKRMRVDELVSHSTPPGHKEGDL